MQLKKLGYHNIDGADPCAPMLEEAKKVDAYKQYLVCGTGDDVQMPIPDSEYRNILLTLRWQYILRFKKIYTSKGSNMRFKYVILNK